MDAVNTDAALKTSACEMYAGFEVKRSLDMVMKRIVTEDKYWVHPYDPSNSRCISILMEQLIPINLRVLTFEPSALAQRTRCGLLIAVVINATSMSESDGLTFSPTHRSEPFDLIQVKILKIARWHVVEDALATVGLCSIDVALNYSCRSYDAKLTPKRVIAISINELSAFFAQHGNAHLVDVECRSRCVFTHVNDIPP
ncbi:hypothetical protein EVAR_16731_1 [Eumeta japonica]|uniref:Uncharacterized protein n=1 Tax=Eumeta variegata TaxID=151549 RepID=A0A4C1V4F5_EUMVA|nr:hypothetical protein EVAR_16731_1 [Eumeta japonica]